MAFPTEIALSLPTHEVVFRLGVATVVGAIIGLNRELRHKPAGLRTQALVTLGAAVATLVISELAAVGGGYDVSAISRVIQGVLTGVGFLGGGVILRDPHETQVHGLTTAASIWISSTLGLACGVGLWRLALAVTLLTLAVLHIGIWIEKAFRRFGPGEPSPTEERRPPLNP
ncbi:MAG TPA: MgtC/SapB family protein [Verrucomicrobiota bacterium]|nr:hypothetical protein [Verrucomicrobiales bacterium]HRI15578.1 MgtC/SapB family protein [Verrucomicrobiota bacterium]